MSTSTVWHPPQHSPNKAPWNTVHWLIYAWYTFGCTQSCPIALEHSGNILHCMLLEKSKLAAFSINKPSGKLCTRRDYKLVHPKRAVRQTLFKPHWEHYVLVTAIASGILIVTPKDLTSPINWHLLQVALLKYCYQSQFPFYLAAFLQPQRPYSKTILLQTRRSHRYQIPHLHLLFVHSIVRESQESEPEIALK